MPDDATNRSRSNDNSFWGEGRLLFLSTGTDTHTERGRQRNKRERKERGRQRNKRERKERGRRKIQINRDGSHLIKEGSLFNDH